jgi:hypothetical protein
MKNKRLITLIDKLLSEKLQNVSSFTSNEPFIGYNPLEKIRGALLHWIAVPFNGVNIYCQLRCPNATQIEQCGNISNICTEKEQNKKIEYDELIEIRNYQEALCKLVFNIPTFDNILSLMGSDFVISEKKKELEEINKKFEENKNKMTETEKSIIQTKIRTLELQIGFILPDDTMIFITRWASGNDVSDIKKINREAFLRAGLLAKHYNKSPSDYISGVFTDYNKQEIDMYAASVVADFEEEKKIEQESKHNWFLGGRKKSKIGFIN